MTRWDGLFGDLEAQLAATAAADLGAEVDARTRGEAAEIRLADRLRAALDTRARLVVAGGLALDGTVRRVGPDWLDLVEDTGREALVPTAALVQVVGLGRWVEPPPGRVAARLGLGSALRALARDRAGLRAHLVDGTVLDATVDRVGADHVDLAVHQPGEPRRAREVRAVAVVPLTALAALRRDAAG